MDTKLKRSRTFHPHTNGQTKVINRTSVQLLRGYNQKHMKAWDENMIYIKHSYNRESHTYIDKSPFEACFGYFIPYVVYGKQGGVREDLTEDSLKEEKNVEKTRKIHLRVQ